MKKASITPRGTLTRLRDNIDLDRTPARLNNPEEQKLKFLLKHTNEKGEVYFSEREFRRTAEAKWDDPAWILDLNKWRTQVFDRVFRKDDEYESKLARPKWSMAEKTWFDYQIIKHAKKHGVPLNGKDWDRISKVHEIRFVGTVIKKGEELLSGKLASVDQEIRRRKATSLRAQFAKMPKLKLIIEKIIDEFSDIDDDSDSGENDEDDFGHMSDDEEIIGSVFVSP